MTKKKGVQATPVDSTEEVVDVVEAEEVEEIEIVDEPIDAPEDESGESQDVPPVVPSTPLHTAFEVDVERMRIIYTEGSSTLTVDNTTVPVDAVKSGIAAIGLLTDGDITGYGEAIDSMITDAGARGYSMLHAIVAARAAVRGTLVF